ncbi:hypothetical protein [Streptomyces sp. NPDC058989]|uniref:hypothetical protein n=1 Tax=Streptomyces sp. NPDC058989 TaxID=3346686 RepID=UPI00368F69C8
MDDLWGGSGLDGVVEDVPHFRGVGDDQVDLAVGRQQIALDDLAEERTAMSIPRGRRCPNQP